MHFGKNKLFMILLLLVFVGQVTAASAVTCFMDNQNQIAAEDHSNHMMGDQSNEDHSSQVEDYCSQGVNCSMIGCVSFTLANLLTDQEILLTPQDIVLLHINLAPSQPLTSLYRPPILS